MIIIDPTNALSIAVLQPSTSKAANFNSSILDLKDYVGTVAVILNAGAKTAGDAGDSTLNVRVVSSAESNGANAVNANVNFTQVTTANSHQVLAVDTRAVSRYLYLVATIAGTNSPAFPVAGTLVGSKRNQG